MRILVTGNHGQLVSSLIALANSEIQVIALGRPELDLVASPRTICTAIAFEKPDIIISAAAYTAVDKAEDEPERAYAINANGAQAIAQAAETLGIPVIHISTDYVFDGEKTGYYSESDTPAPRSVYGASKLEGERLVAETATRHIILRTAWVYSPYGNNFLKTMLRLGQDRHEISVVSDQYGNPTSAANIASSIIHICTRILSGEFHDWGIYHLVDGSEASWSEWAEYIFECAGMAVRIIPIKAEEYPSKATRPYNSRLSTDKLNRVFSLEASDWKLSTKIVVDQVLNINSDNIYGDTTQ